MTTSPSLTGLTAAACLLGMLLAGQPPPFHAEARLVVLHVTVTDGHGERVTNLDRTSFAVFEDGRRQPIAFFRADDVPTSLGLVIDNSGSMRPLRPRVEAAALAFVRASNPLDEVFVLNFADRPRIDVPFTNDVRALEAGVTRVDAIGGTAMRDALRVAERYLGEGATHDRRALLVITDGHDNASTLSTSECRTLVERSGTAVYAIRLVRDAASADTRGNDDELDRLAEVSGGVAEHVAETSDIDQVARDLAHRIRNEYTIAYTPVNQARDGSYRAVSVRVSKPRGLTARTRPGYWATPWPAVSARE
jgi:Ca-activated chloride channel family protein